MKPSIDLRRDFLFEPPRSESKKFTTKVDCESRDCCLSSNAENYIIDFQQCCSERVYLKKNTRNLKLNRFTELMILSPELIIKFFFIKSTLSCSFQSTFVLPLLDLYCLIYLFDIILIFFFFSYLSDTSANLPNYFLVFLSAQ